jgi:hypothetical protein
MSPDVIRAVRLFLDRESYDKFEANEPKCRFIKSAGDGLRALVGAVDQRAARAATA